jgi:hypothetical protein
VNGRRVNVTLDREYADRLSALAQRSHVSEGTLARSLLSSALDEVSPTAERITEILDGIPGLYERVQISLKEADEGKAVPLSELRSMWRG